MNELSTQTSPYLLQHKDNPVHWRVWGDAAFAEAQRLNKPILLSIGYAACHWCHVMAHESFENPFTAEILNALYVPIKLDREERPDLDAIYQQALALMGQQGGWPLTMFLTPDGQPFWGGTYFPPDSRWGRPGFVDALKAAERVWREDPEKALSNVHALRQGLARLSARADPAEITPEHLNAAALKILSYIDPVDGGVGRAPKFPQAPALNLLWRRFRQTGNVRLKEAVLLTLDKMSQGGIYDHLGGGYSRYATDDAWLIPHFEKMLYDNAQLIELLSYAFVETGSALYAERVAETIDWLLREMRVEGAGFAAALDADSEHEEGKFYVWSEAEVREVLGDDADLFCQAYDVGRTGNWEGKVILNRSENPERQSDETEARLAKARAKLLARRSERVRPGRDHKVLADWNGLMISALCTAAQVFERPDWLEAAKSAYGFVRSHATAPDGALQHSWCDRQTHPALLDDYAAISRAALSLYQATGDRGYLGQAKLYVKTAEALFADPEHGGYFTTRAEAAHVIVRLRSAVDHATPAGNGVMLEVLASLFFLTGETAYADAARRLIAAFSGDATRQVLGSCSFLNGVGLLNEAVQITLVSGDGEAALIAALGRKLQPGWIVAWVEEPADLPAHHPAHYKTRIADQATVYICRGAVCSAPVTEADALAKALEMTDGA